MTMRRACVGFSLLEILVAFVILALALGVLMRVFSGALNNTSLSERYATATLIAESKLATVGVETSLVDPLTEGEYEGGYRWQVLIAPDDADPGFSPGLEHSSLFRVEVKVAWQDESGRNRQVQLVSLRTGVIQ